MFCGLDESYLQQTQVFIFSFRKLVGIEGVLLDNSVFYHLRRLINDVLAIHSFYTDNETFSVVHIETEDFLQIGI